MRTSLMTLVIVIALATFVAPPEALAGKPAFPSWSQRIDTAKRFRLLPAFGNTAVLDNETGLVWEQMPDPDLHTWLQANDLCNRLTKGGRLGWRLPSVQELATLVDPSGAGGVPFLPVGHPFTGVSGVGHWTSTVRAENGGEAWAVAFEGTGVANSGSMAFNRHVWCVRGGQGAEVQ